MTMKEMRITGTVTEVRVVNSRIVIVFVKASSPERNKITLFASVFNLQATTFSHI